jgi:uncharacterized repeat protein (TIGR03803 family)
MQRAVTVFALPLLALLAVANLAQARTQEANLINVASFGLGSLTTKPAGIRSDMLVGTDGKFYVSASAGGNGLGSFSSGAITSIATDGTVATVFAASDKNDGFSSFGRLVQASDGNLYGTTFLGGSDDKGVVFKVTLSGTYTVLRAFGKSKQDAAYPYTGLVQAGDGNLYGTTLHGGNNDKGTVYRISTSGEFAIIHHFDGGNGENPEGTLIVGSDGNLYGTTLQGGANSRGTIYRISTTGTFSQLYSFPRLGAFNDSGLATNDTGANPRAALLLAADGNFYGTAFQGGANGYGTVFKMTPAGAVTVVHAFTGPILGGAKPLAGVMQDAAGNLYGTTSEGGYFGQGVVWRIAPSGIYSLLHGFTGSLTDGASPQATLAMLGDQLYGVSFSDSTANAGALFKLDLGTGGVLPVELSVSPTEITIGSSVAITWSSPSATACTPSGAWSDAVVGTSGTLSVTPAQPGIYTYVLSCTDSANVARFAYTALLVRAPALKSVDGGASGSGGGSVSVILLLLLGALLAAKIFMERLKSCP